MTPDGETRLIVIAGYPTDHIKGFAEYEAAIAARRANVLYLSMQVAPASFPAFLAGMRCIDNLAGLVLTIPHKVSGFLAATTHDETARLAGSANLLRPAAQGWHASNVDGTGFIDAAHAAGMRIAGQTVQLLGAGGAGRAVAMAIAAEGPASLAVHDTDPARANALAADLAGAFPAVPSRPGISASTMLVNCSPAGMGEDETMPCDEALIPRGGMVFDIVTRIDTPLLRAAQARGCRTENGYAMMMAEVPLILDWLFDGA
jgi:shikimate dehydrogenase